MYNETYYKVAIIISLYSHIQGHWPIIMKNIHKLHAFKVISVNLIYIKLLE